MYPGRPTVMGVDELALQIDKLESAAEVLTMQAHTMGVFPVVGAVMAV